MLYTLSNQLKRMLSCSCQTFLENRLYTRRHLFSSVHLFQENWLIISRKIQPYYLA
uniref:SNARE-interacting protein KEULE isoform X5 n=1 Tax=Rhizophora mucronata TaxID=61149 RepID=A0A2P2M8S9_RHIMU